MAEAQTVSYIGSFKVTSVALVDQKTPMGNEMVDVTYENGRVQRFTKKTYELVVTDIPSDATIVQKTKFNHLVPSIVSVIAEFDIEVFEIQALLQRIADNIDNSFSRATNYVWTKDDTQFVPGGNPLHTRSLLEADAVIRTIPEVIEQPKTDESAA